MLVELDSVEYSNTILRAFSHQTTDDKGVWLPATYDTVEQSLQISGGRLGNKGPRIVGFPPRINGYYRTSYTIHKHGCDLAFNYTRYGFKNRVKCSNFTSDNNLNFSSVSNSRTSVDNKALGKFYDKVESELSALETFGEMPKTIDSIIGATNAFIGAYRDIRRGKFKYAAQKLGLQGIPKRASTTQSLSSNILAFNYGFMPLANDIVNWSEHLLSGKALINDEDLWVRTTGRASQEFNPVIRDLGDYTSSAPWSVVTVEETRTNSLTVQYGCYLRRRPGARAIHTYGLSNPALLAWEFAPMSVFADMFLNVGDILSDLTALVAFEVKSAWRSEIAEQRISRCISKVKNPASYSTLSSPRSVYLDISKKSYKRESIASMPVRDFELSIPNLNQALNLVALAGTMFGKPK